MCTGGWCTISSSEPTRHDASPSGCPPRPRIDNCQRRSDHRTNPGLRTPGVSMVFLFPDFEEISALPSCQAFRDSSLRISASFHPILIPAIPSNIPSNISSSVPSAVRNKQPDLPEEPAPGSASRESARSDLLRPAPQQPQHSTSAPHQRSLNAFPTHPRRTPDAFPASRARGDLKTGKIRRYKDRT